MGKNIFLRKVYCHFPKVFSDLIFTKSELVLSQVKFLTNKLGAAMVQMSDKVASEMIIRNLSGAILFDSKINIM